MRRSRIFAALLAVLAICTSAAPPAGAQAAGQAVREKTDLRSAAAPAATRPVPVRRATPQTSKSVSERLFDAGWVLFPARIALVIVFVTVGLVLLSCATWGALRVAHSLWHTKWSEPPRKLKRGEVGAAGTSFALEFEERMHENTEADAERDLRIDSLSEKLARLSKEHERVAATVAILLRHHPEVEVDGPEIQG